MTLSTAQTYALQILDWLKPNCHQIAITGSIRRQRPQCADVDLCIIPKTTVYKDLLGHTTGTQNHVWMFLKAYVENFKPSALKFNQKRPEILTGGEAAVHRMTVQLPSCQLDIWFATQETWACKMINSTGSMEHNIWLAQRAASMDLHWFVSQGLAKLEALDHHGIIPAMHDAPRRARAAGLILPAPCEASFYGHLGLQYIDAENRELPWLRKHIDSGL